MLTIEEYEIAKQFLERNNHIIDKSMSDDEFRVLNKMMDELWHANLIEMYPEKNRIWSNVDSARLKVLSDEEFKKVVKKKVDEYKSKK